MSILSIKQSGVKLPLDSSPKKTYNNGSQRLMGLLIACCSQLHGPRGLLHYASSMEPSEDSALPWEQARLTELS